ncbi:hypothetical protein RAH57_15650 [Chryseobacterium sp. CKR4-1]|uniref:hypothetical protein n=1 Tax=Chryseobacterium sp. CKR4-1 TaxID=3068896 RepID=UPI002796CDA4|nr:hypothetical protein [Chryseobacterium sp. CKR4-1]MDQ1805433.1 hypothetical protein [Chryseobacterium sp. CKR4-1]
MANKVILSVFLFCCALGKAQVAIGTNKPEGILHLQNSDKEMGLVIPRVTSAESTTGLTSLIPVKATLVYDNDKKCLRIKTSENTWSGCLIDASKLKKISAKN